MRRRGPAILALAGALVAAGCGAEPGKPVEVDLAHPGPFRVVSFSDVGLTIAVPVDGSVINRDPPGVFRASLGTAYVAGFAYRRKEPLPKSAKDLRTAEKRLLRAIKQRSSTWRTLSAKVTKVDGAPAIEIVGDQTISRGRLRGRSIHIFKGRGEYVIEMEVPKPDFATTDRTVFRPVLASLRVTGRIQPDKLRRHAVPPKPANRGKTTTGATTTGTSTTGTTTVP